MTQVSASITGVPLNLSASSWGMPLHSDPGEMGSEHWDGERPGGKREREKESDTEIGMWALSESDEGGGGGGGASPCADAAQGGHQKNVDKVDGQRGGGCPEGVTLVTGFLIFDVHV